MNIIHLWAGGARPTGLFFWSNSIVLCGRHKRNIPLQPVTSWDQENGHGTGNCPFCPEGPLHKQYHHYRSQAALNAALNRLEAEQ